MYEHGGGNTEEGDDLQKVGVSFKSSRRKQNQRSQEAHLHGSVGVMPDESEEPAAVDYAWERLMPSTALESGLTLASFAGDEVSDDAGERSSS